MTAEPRVGSLWPELSAQWPRCQQEVTWAHVPSSPPGRDEEDSRAPGPPCFLACGGLGVKESWSWGEGLGAGPGT